METEQTWYLSGMPHSAILGLILRTTRVKPQLSLPIVTLPALKLFVGVYPLYLRVQSRV